MARGALYIGRDECMVDGVHGRRWGEKNHDIGGLGGAAMAGERYGVS